VASHAGHEVFSIDYRSRSNEFPNLELDLSQPSSLATLSEYFQDSPSDAVVIHLAAKKSVGESVSQPDLYELNNVGGTRHLLEAMKVSGLNKLIFASTAAVYGDLNPLVDEISETHPISPYASTKLKDEGLIQQAHLDWGLRFMSARYFNVSGAGWPDLVERDGENIFPRILQAADQETLFQIYGTDYPTPDGTCIRDYIHIMDLVDAHLLALSAIQENNLGIVNLGTSQGASVREVVNEFHAHIEFDLVESARRDGDMPSLLTKTDLAQNLLGWSARHSLKDMVDSVFLN
jgi:UDP-glucose 4-epimerase